MKLSAWSLIVTAFTTIVAHHVNFPTADFNEQIGLFQNMGYIIRNDVIIIHCGLVIISMLGLGLLEIKDNPGWVGIGFVCFTVFGIAEITRMTTVNVIVNGLRKEYFYSTSEATKGSISFLLKDVWPFIGTELFLLFIVAFSLGCIFYGVAFFHQPWIGWLFLVWGIFNLLAFANVFVQNKGLEDVMHIFSTVYQPLVRFVIGIWFLRATRKQYGSERAQPS